jgi:hypothetical protein
LSTPEEEKMTIKYCFNALIEYRENPDIYIEEVYLQDVLAIDPFCSEKE